MWKNNHGQNRKRRTEEETHLHPKNSKEDEMTTPSIIIGVDESGRGSLAGPLVVCAVAFLREEQPVTAAYHSLRGDKVVTAGDSKSFSNPVHREVLDQAIRSVALGYTVIERSASEIDARLMFHVFPESLHLAISRLLEQLLAKGFSKNPQDYLVMVDGDVPLPQGLGCPMRAVIDGDKLVWQIGAASIVAKVACDAKMVALHEQYPKYDFAKNKGYPVHAHKKVLKALGPSPVHRKTFRPVAEALGLPPGFEA